MHRHTPPSKAHSSISPSAASLLVRSATYAPPVFVHRIERQIKKKMKRGEAMHALPRTSKRELAEVYGDPGVAADAGFGAPPRRGRPRKGEVVEAVVGQNGQAHAGFLGGACEDFKTSGSDSPRGDAQSSFRVGRARKLYEKLEEEASRDS
jgi:hypothetical protein